MGTWVGVAVMTAGAIALFQLGDSVPRVVVGLALLLCLGMVVAMLWFDRRAERTTRRPTERR
jgi:predicted cobalt transporter CbtA